jgi:predicted MFS family arabinose efflux permease
MAGMDDAAVSEGARRARWPVLGAFALLVACTQVLWLSFAPITDQTQRALGVSVGLVGDLAVANPVLYVLLAIPTGRWIDRAFPRALAAGALLVAAGAAVRAVHPDSFAWIMAGQLVLSAGQPLVLNATTKIAARHFPPGERTAAVAVGSAAQFVGILVAALTAEPLVEAGGLRLLLGVHAAFAVVAAVVVLVSLLVPAAFRTDAVGREPLSWLRDHPLVWQLAALLAVGVGLFNALATWLDAILVGFGLTGVSGTLVAVATIAGIAGAAVLPGLVAARNARRGLFVAATVLTVVVFTAVAVVHNPWFIGFALVIEGFVLLACLPVALDWSELDVGPQRAGTAAAVLMLAGNVGGAVLVLAVQLVIDSPYLALGLMALFGVPGALVARRLPDQARSHRSDDLAEDVPS